jgi:O-antigen/teichoic acid export membrane protein
VPLLKSLQTMLPRQIMGPGLIALAIKMAGAVLAYGMIVALARMMSTEDYGRFAFGLNLSIIAATLGSLGFPTGILRYWPKSIVAGDDAGARGAVSMGYRYAILGGLVLIALAGAGSLVMGLLTGQFQVLQFLAIGILGLIISLGDFSSNLLRAQGSTIVSMLPRDVLWRIFTVLGVGLVFTAGYTVSGPIALIICTAVLAVLTAWQFSHIRKNIKNQLQPSPTRSRFSEVRSSLLPLWVSSVVFAMIQQFDVVVVGSLLGNAQAGAYFAAQKTAALLSLVLIAAGLVAAPSMSSLYHAGKLAELQRLCRSMAGAIVVVTAIGFVMLALLGKFLLGLFDANFVSAYPVLIIVALGTMIDALSGPNAYLMQMTKYETHYLKIMAICYGLVVVAQLILVPRWGGMGAALASAGGVVLWNVWAVLILRRDAGLDPSLLSLVLPPRKTSAT